MTIEQMQKRVMKSLARKSVQKRHAGMTTEDISAYYSRLRTGKRKKAVDSAQKR